MAPLSELYIFMAKRRWLNPAFRLLKNMPDKTFHIPKTSWAFEERSYGAVGWAPGVSRPEAPHHPLPHLSSF
jgi:hypothetical protein